MVLESFKKDMKVIDTWWPERVGEVIKVTKTSVHIVWLDGDKWIYDREHAETFLSKR